MTPRELTDAEDLAALAAGDRDYETRATVADIQEAQREAVYGKPVGIAYCTADGPPEPPRAPCPDADMCARLVKSTSAYRCPASHHQYDCEETEA
jgi:hypothetical protein